jgi:hypothetical protein
VLEMAQCFDDKLATLIVVMTSLAYASKISNSITMGFNILAQLGHQLPTNLSKLDILSRFKQTQIRLGKISDETLVNYRPMTDNRHLQAKNVLAKMELILYQVKPDLQLIDMTIEHRRRSEVLSFFEPTLTVNEHRVRGQAIASAAGDVNFACMLRLM